MQHHIIEDRPYQPAHGRKHGSIVSQRSPRKHAVPKIDTRAHYSIGHHTQITPPDTPNAAHDESGNRHSLVFHNYLRAFYPFDPQSNLPGNDEAIRSAASLHAGDLILIHTIHANGWADGTVLSTGERGWLPTNYCEPYDHPYLRQLLTAMTQFWDLLGGSEGANLGTFIRQDYIRGLIAGVRHLLEHADCLHRDASRVQRHTGVRRMRKGLLADLSTLVQIAKRLQETVTEPYADQTIHVLLDDLMTKAFKVVTRAVGFVDIWTQETAEAKSRIDSGSSFDSVARHAEESQPVGNQPRASISAQCAQANAVAQLQSEEVRKSSDTQPGTDNTRRTSWRPVSASFKNRKGSVAHRLSHIATAPSRVTSSALASEQLAKVHDVCISHIGAFIGHQLHARRSTEMSETTQKLINACSNMLDVIKQVRNYEMEGTISLQEAQDALEAKLTELEQSSPSLTGEVDVDEIRSSKTSELSSDMIDLGTSLIRVAGEAVSRTRSLIEQVGDFELEHPPFPPNQVLVPTSPTSVAPSEPISPSATKDNRLSQKPLPAPPRPPTLIETVPTINTVDLGSPIMSTEGSVPPTPFSTFSHQSISPISGMDQVGGSIVESDSFSSFTTVDTTIPATTDSPNVNEHSFEKDSITMSGSYTTDASTSNRDSAATEKSTASTRATTPDHTKEQDSPVPALTSSFGSMSSLVAAGNDGEAESDMAESQFLQHTYANELTLNKEGQVSGGSLPALVEQLTTHDNAPDPRFVASFFITFRLFANPRELTEALVARFDYIGDSKTVGMPVRLRICNIFKGWFEAYWNADADKETLEDIRDFATNKLRPVLTVAGDRLVELVRRVTVAYENGTMTGPLVIGASKAGLPMIQQTDPSAMPLPIVSKTQLVGLRNGVHANIVEFDPLEVARQMTLLASRIFCDIQTDELLGLEWCKKDSPCARNVKSLCNLNTDVVHVVSDSILAPEQPKQRAAVIKHWVKIAKHCLELNNYESLMAIMCSLNSSVVQRLKRTWQIVSKNTKDRLEELNAVIDISRNQASLRKRLEEAPIPCLPFLGLYLTDLTFVDAGNPKMRELPGGASGTAEPMTVINFDKYARTARIINHMRLFQVPYNLQPVPELQKWMEDHMERMRAGSDQLVGNFHRRSLIIEPKVDDGRTRSYSIANMGRAPDYTRNNSTASTEERPRPPPMPQSESVQVVKEKFGNFLKNNSFPFKAATTNGTAAESQPEVEEKAAAT